jgi:hypothetical protein
VGSSLTHAFSITHPALLVAGMAAPVVAVVVWVLLPPPLTGLRSRVSLGLRLGMLLLIVAAPAGLSFNRVPGSQALIAVVDRSASVNAGGDQERQAVLDLQRGLRQGDRLGVVTVGQQALVEQPPSSPTQGGPSFTDFSTTPNANYTNLEAGLRLAASIEPTDARHHVVLLSDGRQNLGDALGGARLLHSQGIRVDVMGVTVPTGAEARVDAVQAPSTLPAGATTQVQVLLNSNTPQQARLTVLLDGAVVYRAPVSLRAGETQVGVAVPAASPGFHTLKAQLDPPQDTYSENNTSAALIQVLGPPKVLVVEGSKGEGANVAGALTAASLTPQVTSPGAVPDTLAGLAAYQAVALVNLPASALTPVQMQTLQSGVRDLGLGLTAFGGASSMGPGGYAGTPLDATLPVTAQIPQQLKKPPVAVVLVLETMESPSADQVMRGAAKAVVDQLSPQDYVGLADGASGMVVPLQTASDKGKIDKAILNTSFGDSPSYAPFLNAAATALAAQANANKYVILVGDGDAFDDYPGSGRALAAQGINVSAVGINVHNQASSMAGMRALAQAGGGSFYESDDPSQLPQLLLQETQKSLKPWIVQGSFTPQPGSPSPALGGLDAAKLPPIDGYVASTPKPSSEVVLRSPSNDPVLGTWQYGLGRALAWTSDTNGQWTKNLLTSPVGGTLLANIVAWTIPLAQDPNLALQTALVGDQGHVTVQIANPPAGASVVASVAGPDRQGLAVPLSTTAPGRYEGNFPASATGSYLVKVTVSEHGAVTHAALGGLAVAYPAEYQFLGTDAGFLQEVAKAGGGTVLGDAGSAFKVALAKIEVKESLAFLLLAVAALLLPLDIAARRLVVSRGDQKAWSEALQRREATVPAPVEPTLERLKGRLDRAKAGRPPPPSVSPSVSPSGEPAAPEPVPAAEEDDLAARLLARRKKQG